MACALTQGYTRSSDWTALTSNEINFKMPNHNCRNCGSSLIIDGGCGHCGTGRITKIKTVDVMDYKLPNYFVAPKPTFKERILNFFK